MPKESSPGFIRTLFSFFSSDAAEWTGTGAVTLVDSFKPGFRCFLEKLSFRTQTVAATAGSQTFEVRKGGPAGTIIGTLVIALANTDAKGEYIEGALNATLALNNPIGDNDTISITRAAGGTAFGTAPTGQFTLTARQRAQARI